MEAVKDIAGESDAHGRKRGQSPGGGNEPGAGIQVIARAAAILRALARAPGGLSLGQISQTTGLPRSTVQRIIAALAHEGLASPPGPGGGATLGPGLGRLAARASANPAQTIAPYLRELGATVGETVDLAVLSGGSVVFIDQVPGQQRLVARSAIGERFPLHCTANGKAMLTCFPPQDVDALLERSITEHPQYRLRDRAALLQEVEDGRRRHLAYDLGEHAEGICAIGAAVRDSQGRPFAISIPAPAQRFAAQRERLALALLEFRARIQKAIS